MFTFASQIVGQYIGNADTTFAFTNVVFNQGFKVNNAGTIFRCTKDGYYRVGVDVVFFTPVTYFQNFSGHLTVNGNTVPGSTVNYVNIGANTWKTVEDAVLVYLEDGDQVSFVGSALAEVILDPTVLIAKYSKIRIIEVTTDGMAFAVQNVAQILSDVAAPITFDATLINECFTIAGTGSIFTPKRSGYYLVDLNAQANLINSSTPYGLDGRFYATVNNKIVPGSIREDHFYTGSVGPFTGPFIVPNNFIVYLRKGDALSLYAKTLIDPVSLLGSTLRIVELKCDALAFLAQEIPQNVAVKPETIGFSQVIYAENFDIDQSGKRIVAKESGYYSVDAGVDAKMSTGATSDTYATVNGDFVVGSRTITSQRNLNREPLQDTLFDSAFIVKMRKGDVLEIVTIANANEGSVRVDESTVSIEKIADLECCNDDNSS